MFGWGWEFDRGGLGGVRERGGRAAGWQGGKERKGRRGCSKKGDGKMRK